MSPVVKTNRQRRSKAIRKLLTTSGLTHLPYLPTSIHLRAEIALYTCNILLICASSHNLYRHAYLTNAGDWRYLLAAAVWLGRHVVLRIICASSWVDVGDGMGDDRHVIRGLGYNRRRDFNVWLDQQKRNERGRSFVQSVYGWVKWIVSAMSPINIMAKMVYLIKQYGMAGQYCDGSASRGVASAALMMHGTGGSFGSGIDDHHTSSRTNKHGYYGGQHSQTETHTNVILFLARVWGTLCALSSALWALIQSGDVGGETMGHIGATILRWFKSCLAIIVKPSQSSSDHYPGSQPGGKKSRRKQHNQTGFSDPRMSNIESSDRDSLDFLNGNLQMAFQIFPDHIRSRALHIQQMRTSEVFISLQKTWEAFPPAQMQIATVTFIILAWAWLFRVDDGYYYRIFLKYSDEDNDYSIMPNFGFHKNLAEEQNGGVHGGQLLAYWAGLSPPYVADIFDADAPSLLSMSFRMISYGTAASLLMYGRVLLPIPEFVAGTNVLKAVRAEARSLGTGAIGKNSLKHSKDDVPWMEHYKSISTENRLRLYYKVAIIRILENVLLCAILPQTEVVCRMTEHCEPGPLLWGASGVTGISGSRYIKGSFDALMKDLIITRISVVVIACLTALLLMAQMTVMNRTYFSLMGYICGEWKIVREDGKVRNSFFGKYSTSPPLRRMSNSTVMQWDPKRRYQKGDRVAFEYCIYEAKSNSPEGPPFDTYLRAAHDLYNEELGHRSTSSLVSNISMGCWMLASMLCGFMFLWKSAGWNFIPLLLMSSACAIAGSVTAHLCDSCSRVIIDLAEEIDAVTSQ